MKKNKKKENDGIDGFSLVESQKYEFVAQSITSQSGIHRNLTTLYTVTVDGNNSKAYLPFIGRAHSATYGGDGGIEFDGEMTDYKTELKERKKEKNNQQLVSYKVKGNKDTYTMYFSISKSGSASLSASSVNRQTVTFNGNIQKVKVEEVEK